MSIRVGCFTASCKKCSECTGTGIDPKGKEWFSCATCGEKHKEIDARKCKSFRCNNADKGILCEGCRKGE